MNSNPTPCSPSLPRSVHVPNNRVTMAGLPSVPGLPQKPVHTNLPPTRKEREAAAAAAALARANQPSPRGGLPPWRRDNREGGAIPPWRENRSGPSRVSAEPQASYYGANMAARPPSMERHTYSIGDPTHRLSSSSSRGDPTHRHHPYSRPSGRAEPTTPAVLQQPQAVTQLRAENPYGRRPDHEPAVRGLSKMRGLHPAKPPVRRDGKRAASVESRDATSATTKRKASATAPSSPPTKRQRTGTSPTAPAVSSVPVTVPAPVSAPVPAPGSQSVASAKEIVNEVGPVTSGPVSSPDAPTAPSAPSAPTVLSRTRRSTRRTPAGPTPRPSAPSSSVDGPSGSAKVMAWALTISDDDQVKSSVRPAASAVLASSDAAPAPASASASVDVAQAKSTSGSASPVTASAVVSVSPGVAVPAASSVTACESVSASATVSPVPAAEPTKSADPAPAVASVSATASGKSVRARKSVPGSGKSLRAGKSTSSGKSVPAGKPTSSGKSASAGKPSASKSSSVSDEEYVPTKKPARKAPSAARKSTAGKSLSRVKTGRVVKSKSPSPELTLHPSFGGKSTWPGKPVRPAWLEEHLKEKSSSGGEDGNPSLSTGSGVEARSAVGGKTVYITSSPEPEDDEVLREDAPGTTNIQVSSSQAFYTVSTTVDKVSGAKRARKSPPTASSGLAQVQTQITDLSKTEDAVRLTASVDGAARLFLVDTSVLEGFSLWWSDQDADESSYNWWLDGVLEEANETSSANTPSQKKVTGEDILHVVEMILGMATGESEPPSAGAQGCSPTEIWLAALMHGVLGLPEQVTERLLSSLRRLCTDCGEGGNITHPALLLDAGLEKLLAAARIFDWADPERWLIASLAHRCTVGEDGRPLHNGVALNDELCGWGVSEYLLATRQEVVMDMTKRAMAYLEGISEAPCRRDSCQKRREDVITDTLWEAQLYPWSEVRNGPALLADGWSIHDITAVLSAHSSSSSLGQQNNNDRQDRTSDPLPANTLCSGSCNPLPKLYEAVGMGVGGRLASIVQNLSFD